VVTVEERYGLAFGRDRGLVIEAAEEESDFGEEAVLRLACELRAAGLEVVAVRRRGDEFEFWAP
jgi:hypothetical protein